MMGLRRITTVGAVALLAAGMFAQTATAQVALPGTAGWSDPAFLIMPAKSEQLVKYEALGQGGNGPPIQSATWVTIYNADVTECRTRVRFYDEDNNLQCTRTTFVQPNEMYTVSTAAPNPDVLRRANDVCGPLTDYEGIAIVYTEKDQCGKYIMVDAERIYYPPPPPPRCVDEQCLDSQKEGPPPPPPFIRDLRVIDVSQRDDKIQNGD